MPEYPDEAPRYFSIFFISLAARVFLALFFYLVIVGRNVYWEDFALIAYGSVISFVPLAAMTLAAWKFSLPRTVLLAALAIALLFFAAIQTSFLFSAADPRVLGVLHSHRHDVFFNSAFCIGCLACWACFSMARKGASE